MVEASVGVTLCYGQDVSNSGELLGCFHERDIMWSEESICMNFLCHAVGRLQPFGHHQ